VAGPTGRVPVGRGRQADGRLPEPGGHDELNEREAWRGRRDACPLAEAGRPTAACLSPAATTS
jgi:hypothetical protein